MNPIELIVIATAGILIVTLMSNFLTSIKNIKTTANNEIDLLNIINIYENGLNTNASFNTTYKPSINGTLIINEQNITLNNATRKNNGMKNQNCNYNIIKINESGASCLNN